MGCERERSFAVTEESMPEERAMYTVHGCGLE